MNYQRESFAENIGLEIPSYTVENLKTVCRKLTKKVNETANQVSRGEDGTMILSEEIDRQVVETMEAQGKVYEVLSGCLSKAEGASVSLDFIDTEFDRSIFSVYR